MGQPHPLPTRHQLPNCQEQNQERNVKPPLRRDIAEADVHALMEENAELRRLVIELSKLVIRNVAERG
jgi:hypothetical protein